MVMTNNETTTEEKCCESCKHLCLHCGTCIIWCFTVDFDGICKYYERREDTDA